MKVSIDVAYSLHALMYMVRHITQLPATTNTIAKAEGIPVGYLSKIFGKLVKANFVKAVSGGAKGYVFFVQPEEIIQGIRAAFADSCCSISKIPSLPCFQAKAYLRRVLIAYSG